MLTHKKILKLRKQFLGPPFSLSYRVPLHIVKGEAQYLFDARGKRYLDAVNNISHVGHCHPRVISAAEKQARMLNTNTRYLNEVIVNYARDLTNTLPDGLDICYFTNSGSESNDLALRMARFFTSSREGGEGGLDIYMSRRLPDQTWGLPQNLGPQVNSKYNEDFPTLSADPYKRNRLIGLFNLKSTKSALLGENQQFYAKSAKGLF